MNGGKLDWVKENSEAVMCFALFLILLCVSVYFMGLEKRRTSMIEAGAAFAGMSRRQEAELNSRQANFLGLLVSKPISYYNLIVRRNPFAPLPAFSPPEEVQAPETIELPVEVSPEKPLPPPPPPPPTVDLILSGTIFLPEQGKWIAQIENLRTGEIYFMGEGEIIAEIFKVKKIERSRVILFRDGDKDIELKLGVKGD